MNKMSFRIRDTSTAFMPIELSPPVQEKKRTSIKKNKKSEKSNEPKKKKDVQECVKPKTWGRTGSSGFHIKHDPSNQCDHF